MPQLPLKSQFSIQPLLSRCAGICYPRDGHDCLAYFRQFFDQPGATPWPDAANSADAFFAALSPHIDFRVSTAAYSHAFARMLTAPMADVYVVLGVGHRAYREWSIDGRDYVTPMGLVPIEAALAHDLVSGVDFSLADPKAHEGEHSIEFVLVLLQALRRLRGVDRPFTFLPVLCGGQFDAVELGQPPPLAAPLYRLATSLRELLQPYGKRVQLIVSIDGCHLGPRFGHRYKVNPMRLRETAEWEETLWTAVEQRDLPQFYQHLGQDKNARYFDGVGALSLFMAMYGADYTLQRTHYEQWFEPRDASAVTFTSGYFTAG